MNILKTLPSALATIVLGAHFVRAGSSLLVLFCLVLIPLCFLRLPRARAVVRFSLSLGVIIWVMTAMRIVGSKMDAGVPAGRSLVILTAVASFTAFAAWILPPVESKSPVNSPDEAPE